MEPSRHHFGGKQSGKNASSFIEMVGIAHERGYISRETAERVVREFCERTGFPLPVDIEEDTPDLTA